MSQYILNVEAGKNSLTLASLKEKIVALTMEASENNMMNIVAELGPGVYTLSEPFVFSTEEYPQLKYVNITLRAQEGTRPVISSCVRLDGEFAPVEGTPYYKYQFEKDENGKYPRFHDLYFAGKRMEMAKSPVWKNPEALSKEDRGPGYINEEGVWMSEDFSAPVEVKGLYAPMEVAEKIALEGVDCTELCMYVQWEHVVLRAAGVDLSDIKEFDGETYALINFDENFVPCFVHGTHTANNIFKRETFIRNNPAFLTNPGSFAYNWNTGTLYIIPEENTGQIPFEVSYAKLESLLEVKGMSDFTVEGLTFTGVSSSYICDGGYYALLSNVERRRKNMEGDRLRHGAIVTSNVRNLLIRDCDFIGIGCNGIQLCDRTVKASVHDNRFVDVAMSGVSIGNPTINWSNPGNQNFAISVINNYFEHIAYDYPNAACIFLGITDGAMVRNNTINGCGYSGIYGGWGWDSVTYEPGEEVNLRNVEISYNKVSNFMDVCRDGAAIYVTGGNAALTHVKRFNSIHHNYAFLKESGHTYRRGYYLDGATTAFILSRFTSLPIVSLYFVCQMEDIIKCAIGFILIKKGIWLNNLVEAEKKIH